MIFFVLFCYRWAFKVLNPSISLLAGMNNSGSSEQGIRVVAPVDPPYSMNCFTDLNNGTCDKPGIDIDIVKILLEEFLKLKIM